MQLALPRRVAVGDELLGANPTHRLPRPLQHQAHFVYEEGVARVHQGRQRDEVIGVEEISVGGIAHVGVGDRGGDDARVAFVVSLQTACGRAVDTCHIGAQVLKRNDWLLSDAPQSINGSLKSLSP